MGKIFPVVAVLCALMLPAQDRATAEKLYNRTDYDGALKMLRGVQHPDAATLALMGRSAFMLGDFRKATDYFERAAALEPDSSEYAMWLGRTWGRRAEMASPLFAPMNASRARRYFERALDLDPGNRDAMTDLFDYYLEAPGFLGGGFDKAESIARRISKADPAEYQYELAQLAKKRSQYRQAEEHLRRAIELAPHQVGRVVDLAKFLARQGRMQESEAALAQADRISPGNPRLLYERASIYVEQHQKLQQARELLQRYLRSNLTPDDPPRDAAERLLKQAAGA
ncbi:MAG TPA: tetratricopeptide repeat protein [Bryobacteraceae bacterium]|nr:tetratricopeptide repeat protein [Bryobacteraceae bacterium]